MNGMAFMVVISMRLGRGEILPTMCLAIGQDFSVARLPRNDESVAEMTA